MLNMILKEKVEQAVKLLNEKNIDTWLTYVRESSINHDPILDLIGGPNCTWETAFIINKDGDSTVIAGSLELENYQSLGIYKNYFGYLKSIKELLIENLTNKNPSSIAINFSKNSVLADGLTHGMYLILNSYLAGTGLKDKLVSAEEIISALRGRKSQAELTIMKEAIAETLKIFDEVTQFIAPGKSEIEIANFIKSKVNERGFGLAWDEDHCPAVFTGPDTQGAHSGPTDRKVERGHLINIDFGITYKGYCSDIQRAWYVLREGEDKAPEPVQKGFEIIRDAIQMVADALKPGVQGCEMDDIARNYITSQGYEEYPHGLGHQVGRSVHDGGGGLFPRWEKYGNAPYLLVEENQVYTIEPRLTVKDYGTSTLEEEVVITKNGCEFLSKPQKELMLIK